jgi:hypothetical protein
MFRMGKNLPVGITYIPLWIMHTVPVYHRSVMPDILFTFWNVSHNSGFDGGLLCCDDVWAEDEGSMFFPNVGT